MTPPLLSSARWIFALKLFLAAMIAYTIAVRIGLPQPYWAIVTAAVVMDPFTGAIRSKAVYRLTGTICAGILSIILASIFANTSLLLIICTGIMASVIFGLGWMDRSPRSYGIRLCGLTLIVIIVPEVSHPGTMFDQTIARVCEIGLGVICCSVVDSIIAPRSIRKSTEEKLCKMTRDGLTWFDDILRSPEENTLSAQDRLRMIGEATELSTLGASMRYDPTVPRRERKIAFAIQQRILRLIPLISALEDRLSHLDPVHLARLQPDIEEARRLLETGSWPSENFMAKSWEEFPPEKIDWATLTERNIARITSDALVRAAELRALAAALGKKATLPAALEEEVRQAKAFPLQPDQHTAVGVGLTILITYALLGFGWYLTAWPQAPAALLIACVSLAFFGGLDQAGVLLKQFTMNAVIAQILGGVLYFGMLPLANQYSAFLLVMALFIMPLAAWSISNRMAVLMIAMALSTLQLQGSYRAIGFDTYFSASIASLIGIFIAHFVVRMVRQLGADHVVQRFTREARREVATLTRYASQRDRDLYVARALDRIGALTTRMQAVGGEDESAVLMTRLRAGANIADLRLSINRFSGEVREKVELIFATIREDIENTTPSPILLEHIDDALTTALQGPAGKDGRLMRGLIGLRYSMFKHGKPWRPIP